MAENLTPKKYIDSNNMKQILTAVKNEISNDNSIITTESEFLALPEEQKLNNSYYLYDIGVHYKNGVAYSRKKPIQLTMEEYKALGKVDPDQEYIVSADAEGILLEASDIGYSNAVSNLPCTTVQGAIDELNSNLGGLSDNIDGFKNVQIISALGSTKLKEIIQSEFTKLQNGRGMIRINDGTTLYCGTYIKYSNTQGSTTFTNVEGTSYIWTIRGDTVTLQELATMDKVEWKQLTLPTPIIDGKTRTYSIDLSVYKEIAIQTWINEWETNIDFRVVPLMESEMGYVVSYTNGTSYMTYRIAYNKSKIKIDIEAENMASQNYPLLSLLLAR